MTPRSSSTVPDGAPTDPQGPVRTCVGCRGRATRSVLVRVALESDHAVIDSTASMPGRGAWLHRDPDCLALALQRRAIGRALRAPAVDVSGLTLEER